MNRKFVKNFDKETGVIEIAEIRTDSISASSNPPLSYSEYIFSIGEYNVYDILGEKANLQQENEVLKDTLRKLKTEIEEKIGFCESEAEGHINHEKCNIAIRFFKKILDDLKEV